MQSMDEIYQEHAQMVYRYLRTLTHDMDLAEELTQETFYQAIRSIQHYDYSCKITTWLCAIAKNQWRTYLRKHPLCESIDDRPEQASDLSAEDHVLASVDRVSLLKQLHACKEPYREVLYLRIFGNLSFRELGDIMGKSENWARVTFYRGKEYLRKELSGHEK